MNVKQKIGLGIIAPMFALAVGHTVINKVNANKEIAKTEIVNSDNTSRIQSNAASAEFKASKNIKTELDTLNKLLNESFNQYDKDVKTLNNITKKIANHESFNRYDKDVKTLNSIAEKIANQENYVECGD